MPIRFYISCLLALLTFSMAFSMAFSQDFQWVKEIKGEEKSTANLTISDDNELIVAKSFSELITVGNNKIESYGQKDFLLIKYDSKGKTDWIRHFGSSSNEEIKSIGSDDFGNIFIAGNFNGKMSLGTMSISANGEEDIFIAKFDKKGNCLWVIPYGSKGKDEASCLNVDKEGNLIVSGRLGRRNDEDTLSLIFISKFDRTGKLLWSKKILSDDIRSESKALTSIHASQIIIAGNFYTDLQFENIPLFLDSEIIKETPNLFLISLDKQGNLVWSNLLSTLDFDSFISIESALTSDDNAIYIGGSFIGNISIGDNVCHSNGIGNQDIFIASCNKNGSWKWVQTSKGDDSNYGRDYLVALKSFKRGILYGAGYFDGELTIGNIVLNENKELYDSDIFIISMDTTGNVFWGKQAGAISKKYFKYNDDVSDFAVSSREEVYLAGHSGGNAKFDKIQLKSSDKTCNYLAKISKSEKSILKEDTRTETDTVSVSVYPNPALSEDVTITLEGTGDRCKVLLYDNLGNLILQLYHGKTKRKELYQFSVKSSELKEGMYHLKVVSNDKTYSYKLVISK